MIIVIGVMTLLMTAFTVTTIGGRMSQANKVQHAAEAAQKSQTDMAFGALDEVINNRGKGQ